jgi:formylglycine-generating enzyme required for sulfatase activity
MSQKKVSAVGVGILVAASSNLSCGKPAQLLVVVDTDAPLGAQLIADSTIAPEAAVDTISIDEYDETWTQVCIDDVNCTASYVLPEPSLWPFSFGVPTPKGGSTLLHLRIRAFRGAIASPGFESVDGGSFSTLDPPPQQTIERLVELTLPTSGETVVSVLLSADCLARPASFVDLTTCIDGSTFQGAPAAGVVQLAAAPPLGSTQAGSWSRAHEVLCTGGAPAGVDAVCIPGGFSYIGETDLAGEDQQSDAAAAPPMPVWVHPFWMDRTEVTVGRFRALVNKGLQITTGTDPIPPDTTNDQTRECKWLGSTNVANDDYPVNCVTWGLARRACMMSGGDLPAEAQWEHAARGRGQERLYPWGNQAPSCCTTAAGLGTECKGTANGPQKVGSYLGPACDGVGDVSRDKVLDLGGNLGEFCADTLVDYGEGCWSAAGIFSDAPCADTTMDAHAARGGNWNSGSANTRSAFRHSDTQGQLYGFRCVYPDGAS